MKRRTLLLSGGALASISFSLTATSAQLANSVTPSADFRVRPEETTAKRLTLDDNEENVQTTHDWFIEPLWTDVNVDSIDLLYPTGTDFSNVGNNDITVEFYQGGSYSKINIENTTYSGSEVTLNVTDNNAVVEGKVKIEIQQLNNPTAGSYTPTARFNPADTTLDPQTADAEMGISSGAADFDLQNFTPPSELTVGEDIVFEYDVENVNSEFGSRDIEETVGDELTTRTVSLDGTTSTTLQHWETTGSTYTTTTDDAPGVDVGADIPNDADANESQSQFVTVGGAFGLDLSTYKQRQSAIHDWETGFFDNEIGGEVDEITVEYTSSGGGGGGGGGNGNGSSKGFDFSDLTDSGVTISIKGTPINFTSGTYSGNSQTFSLDSSQDTSVDGEVIVQFDSLKSPQGGDYTGTITLRPYTGSSVSNSVTFTIN